MQTALSSIATSYQLGYAYNSTSIDLIDLNNDNWLDIVIVCYNTD